MSTPPVDEIARRLYPRFTDEVPSKAFTSAMPLSISIFSVIIAVGLRPKPVGPYDWVSVGLLLFLMVMVAVLTVTDSVAHTRRRRKALERTHRLISIVSLDTNFQMTRCAEGIALTGTPTSSTPALSQNFLELRVVVTEEQLVAIAPLLEPLWQRFQQTAAEN